MPAAAGGCRSGRRGRLAGPSTRLGHSSNTSCLGLRLRGSFREKMPDWFSPLPSCPPAKALSHPGNAPLSLDRTGCTPSSQACRSGLQYLDSLAQKVSRAGVSFSLQCPSCSHSRPICYATLHAHPSSCPQPNQECPCSPCLSFLRRLRVATAECLCSNYYDQTPFFLLYKHMQRWAR